MRQPLSKILADKADKSRSSSTDSPLLRTPDERCKAVDGLSRAGSLASMRYLVGQLRNVDKNIEPRASAARFINELGNLVTRVRKAFQDDGGFMDSCVETLMGYASKYPDAFSGLPKTKEGFYRYLEETRQLSF